ncbi:hypothetical protein GH714_019545 [Hevea brasiliensis]|uniref:DUF4283 domain-containing protein n=1 Tax=Hevea brasiliensis TaxID=3981 RepID=A0A6A6L9V6_HEVBR|nr:hypothetical protein GH714_019545 [Hevea brasiliensis]
MDPPAVADPTVEEGNEVYIPEAIEGDVGEKASLNLIAKLWTNKHFNAYPLMDTMTKAWKTSEGVEARLIRNNLFSFQFFHWRDKQKVFDSQTWHFDNQVLILKDVSGEEQPSMLQFFSVPHWVHIYDWPLKACSRGIVQMIASKIGLIEEYDEQNDCDVLLQAANDSRPSVDDMPFGDWMRASLKQGPSPVRHCGFVDMDLFGNAVLVDDDQSRSRDGSYSRSTDL